MSEVPPTAQGQGEGVEMDTLPEGYNMGYEGYYLEDGTYVMQMPDGTEHRFAPDPAAQAEYGAYAGSVAAPQTEDFEGVAENPMLTAFPPATAPRVGGGSVASNSQVLPSQGVASQSVGGSQGATGQDEGGVQDMGGEESTEDDEGMGAQRVEDDPDSLHDDGLHHDWWILDFFTEIAVSKAFKVWFGALLISAFVTFLALGFNYMFATLFRMLIAPDPTKSSFWQSMAFLIIFITMSFFIGTVCGTCFAMITNFWRTTRAEADMWGYGWGGSQPPGALHFAMVSISIPLPVLWGLVQTMVQKESGIFFFQQTFFVAYIVTIFFVLVYQLWLFLMALWWKSHAYRQRLTDYTARLEYDQRREAALHAAEREQGIRSGSVSTVRILPAPENVRLPWYHSELVLREFGLDGPSATWMLLVVFLGLIPSIGVSCLLVMSGGTVSWNMQWVIIGVGFLFVLAVLRELKRRGGALMTGGCVILIMLTLGVGVLAIGLSGNTWLFAVFAVNVIFTHALLLRKRQYQMQPHDIEDEFGPAVDMVEDSFDSYICFCRRSLCYALSLCWDVASVFGKHNPQVSKFEKKEHRRRFALFTDQRFLLGMWSMFWIIQLIALGYSKKLSLNIGAGVAGETSDAPVLPHGGLPASPLCAVDFGRGNAKVSTLDLALLSTLAYEFQVSVPRDEDGKVTGLAQPADYSKWFSGRFTPMNHFANNYKTVASWDSELRWLSFKSDGADMVAIVMAQGLHEGEQMMRNIDLWGESLVVHALRGLVPFVGLWPSRVTASFVNNAAFLKKAYGFNQHSNKLEKHIRSLSAVGYKVVVTGHGFAGAIARLAAQKAGVQSMTFGTPGTAWLREKLGVPQSVDIPVPMVVSTRNDLLNELDDNADVSKTFVSCVGAEGKGPTTKCSEPTAVANAVLKMCGDKYGRHLNV